MPTSLSRSRSAPWFTLLADRFDLPLDSNTAVERDRLWTSVITAHRRWAATQR